MKPLSSSEKKKREQAILRAAARVLSARGFEALKMEEVAREAGLAKGTLFLSYRSKEDLVLALFSGMAADFAGALAALAAAKHPPEKLLSGLVLLLLNHFDRKRDITGYSGGLPLAGQRKEALRARFAGNLELIAAVLRRCAEGGLLRLEDPLFAASALFGLCRGSTSYARAFGRRLPAGERSRRLTEIFLNGTRKDK